MFPITKLSQSLQRSLFSQRAIESFSLSVHALKDPSKNDSHWTLVSGTLALKGLKAEFNVTKAGRKLNLLTIHATLSVTGSTGEMKPKKLDLTGESKGNPLNIPVIGCDIFELICTPTGSKCDLGFVCGPKFTGVHLKLDWSNREGDFGLTFGNYTFGKDLLDLQGVVEPKILMLVQKWGFSGVLEGRGKLGDLNVDMNSKLPRGLFPVENVDIKKLNELVRKFKNVGKVCKVMSRLSSSAETGEEIAKRGISDHVLSGWMRTDKIMQVLKDEPPKLAVKDAISKYFVKKQATGSPAGAGGGDGREACSSGSSISSP